MSNQLLSIRYGHFYDRLIALIWSTYWLACWRHARICRVSSSLPTDVCVSLPRMPAIFRATRAYIVKGIPGQPPPGPPKTPYRHTQQRQMEMVSVVGLGGHMVNALMLFPLRRQIQSCKLVEYIENAIGHMYHSGPLPLPFSGSS